MGDLNAKIGKEEVYQQVVGKNTLHESTNRNGEWVCEYAIANNMKIVKYILPTQKNTSRHTDITRWQYGKSNRSRNGRCKKKRGGRRC